VTFTAIVQAETFRDWLAPVAALVKECTIHIGETGLAITAVDPANIAIVDTNLDADAFESYDADVGTIGVTLDRLEDVVGFGSSGQLVQLELDEATRTLEVTVGVLDYTLALIDPASIRQEPELPDLDLPLRAVLQGEDVATMVEAADMVSDHVALGGDGDTLYADAEGDSDDTTVSYDHVDLIEFEAADVDSIFSLDYCKDMSGAVIVEATDSLVEEIEEECSLVQNVTDSLRRSFETQRGVRDGGD
jgi:proliferating cell nuclear antigen